MIANTRFATGLRLLYPSVQTIVVARMVHTRCKAIPDDMQRMAGGVLRWTWGLR